MTLTAVAFQSLMTFASAAGWAATLRSSLPELDGPVFRLPAPDSIAERPARSLRHGLVGESGAQGQAQGGGGQQLERGTSVGLTVHLGSSC